MGFGRWQMRPRAGQPRIALRVGTNGHARGPAPVWLRAALILAASILWVAPASAETLTGTALFRERIALPPDATFEAVIEDISRADAPSVVLGRTIIEAPGQPPIDFAIDYDPAALDPRVRYALRATIRQGARLLFTTDRVVPVLQDGADGTVEVILRMVAGDAGDGPSAALPAHDLRLPATFRGLLPCADCEGIRHHLDLWPDQHYHMSREWIGGDGPLRRDEIGRWSADPARGAIVLHGASEMPLFWQVEGPDRLRQMDIAGAPITSDLDYSLTSDGTLALTDLQDLVLLGRMTYMADAALFEECISGLRYPIAQEGDYLALERAYLEAATGPGAPVTVHVEGGLALRPGMEGPPRQSLIVDRFVAVRDDEACARPAPRATLTDTYWRIDTLMGQAVVAQDNRREPHIVLSGGDERRFRATVGCNQIIGRYDLEGDTLSFDGAAGTLMLCPAPLDAMEQDLHEALPRIRAVRLDGPSLELIDAQGTTLARLAAVYLR